MRMFTRQSDGPSGLFSTPFAVTFGAIVLSVLVCAAIAWIEYREARVLRHAVTLADKIGQARIDLAQGFLHVAIARDDSSPFDRNQGLALLQQAATSLQRCIEAARKGNNAALVVQDEESLARFSSSLASFSRLLDQCPKAGVMNPALATKLRQAFYELDRQANRFDEQIIVDLQQESAQLRRTFSYPLGIAILLLSGICLAVFLLGRAQQRATTALMLSERRLRSLLETIPDMVWLKDMRGVFLGWNKAFESFLGLSREDITGKTDYDLVDKDLADFFRERDRVAIDANKPSVNEEWLTFADTGYRGLFETIKTPVRDPEGKLMGVLGIARDVTERKATEQALRESEERLRLFIDHAPVALAMFDNNMCYLAASRRWIKDYALGNENIAGKSHYEIFPEIPEEWRAAHRRGLAGEVVRCDEDRFDRPQGYTQWLRWELRPWYVDDGSIGGIVIFAEDITEAKKTENARRESEERFRQVAENAGEWIWEVDATGMFTFCSPAVEAILGYSPEELIGTKHFFDLFSPDVQSALKETALTWFGQTESFQDFVNRNVRKDGTVAILETSATPFFDSNGQLLGFRGVARDITERRRMQEAHWLLAKTLEQTADAIAITDPDGVVVYANRAFETMTGFTPQDLLGSPYDIVDSRHNPALLDHRLKETLRKGVSWAGHVVSQSKAGTVYEESVTVAPVYDDSGKIVNFVIAKRDISEALSLQRQLAQAQKMEAIGTLAGGIAHDFNNILFAITGFTELALEDLPEDSQIRADLERVLEAGKRAAAMVGQILAFSRPTETERRPLDIAPVVKEGLKFLRTAIPSTTEIRQTIDPNLGTIYADPTQIHQILMNLCTNAAHAMQGKPGVLSVELARVEVDEEFAGAHPPLVPGACVVLRVADTGHGIRREDLSRIFEPYFTTKKAGEGTGLGLSLVHGIVRSSGGIVTVYSDPGEGTTFNVFFPVIEDANAEHTAEEDDSIPTGNERILLVDDEALLVELGQTTLERLGYNVAPCTDPVIALECFSEDPQRFDLVLTDLTMPKMTGTELAHNILAIRPDMPIILCTGFMQRLQDTEARQAGFRAIVGKPILKRDIARVIREVLDNETGGVT